MKKEEEYLPRRERGGHVVPSVRGHGGRGNERVSSIRKQKLSYQPKKVTVTFCCLLLLFFLKKRGLLCKPRFCQITLQRGLFVSVPKLYFDPGNGYCR